MQGRALYSVLTYVCTKCNHCEKEGEGGREDRKGGVKREGGVKGKESYKESIELSTDCLTYSLGSKSAMYHPEIKVGS